MSTPRTIRGQETRGRITAAASELVHDRGVARTSLDDVIERAGVSKSQLYLYFADRDALLRAVIAYNTEFVLSAVDADLARGSWRAIRAWFASMTKFPPTPARRPASPAATPPPPLPPTPSKPHPPR